MQLKLLQITIQKIAKVTGDLIGNKTANKTTKVSRNQPQYNSGTVENETENIEFVRKLPKVLYIFPEKIWKLVMI